MHGPHCFTAVRSALFCAEPAPADNAAHSPSNATLPFAPRHCVQGVAVASSDEMRRLAAADPARPAIGKAQRPQQENFRLGQQASLAFAPRELAKVEVGTDIDRRPRVHIGLFGLGMLGPHGALPIHFTELVRERVEARRDATLADFLDLFHHRAFTHIYRAWAQSQSTAGLDRADEETFSAYVARLGGDEPSEVRDSALAPHARWASSAHRVRAARNPDGLVSTLSRFFGVGVVLREYVLH